MALLFVVPFQISVAVKEPQTVSKQLFYEGSRTKTPFLVWGRASTPNVALRTARVGYTKHQYGALNALV